MLLAFRSQWHVTQIPLTVVSWRNHQFLLELKWLGIIMVRLTVLDCSEALSRQDIETMKMGANRAMTERRNCGPTGDLAKVIVGSWDFSDGINTIMGKDKGPYLYNLDIVNCPTRAMTGHNFTGHNFDWKHAQDEYGAIHFHDDDIDDARWDVDFEWDVPEGQNSAFYAAKITTDAGDEDYIPFWVA